MPFNRQEFDEAFDFAAVGNYVPMMKEFQAEPTEENEDVVIYRAVIATKEPNVNMVMLDDLTLRNVAAECNRETAENDIPIHRLHNSREFQIGVMLTGVYEASNNRTTGTFNISKDDDTEVLRKRMELGIVRDMSPKLRGRVKCNVCDERMYVYGGCANDHWLGEVIKVEGKEIQVTGTYEDAHVIEVSVVPRGAFPGATLFSEKEDMLVEAVKEGALNEKAIHIISETYSVDMEKFVIKPPKSTSLPTGGPKPMSKPNDAETRLLQDQLSDSQQTVSERDETIKNLKEQLKDRPTVEEYTQFQEDAAETKKTLVEKEGELGRVEGIVADYDACVEYVRTKAIEFYAKIRDVETDNTTDKLFTSRKQSLENSKSLAYLIGAYEQYQESYYADATEFGGETMRGSRQDASEGATVIVNPNHFDI